MKINKQKLAPFCCRQKTEIYTSIKKFYSFKGLPKLIFMTII